MVQNLKTFQSEFVQRSIYEDQGIEQVPNKAETEDDDSELEIDFGQNEQKKTFLSTIGATTKKTNLV